MEKEPGDWYIIGEPSASTGVDGVELPGWPHVGRRRTHADPSRDARKAQAVLAPSPAPAPAPAPALALAPKVPTHCHTLARQICTMSCCTMQQKPFEAFGVFSQRRKATQLSSPSAVGQGAAGAPDRTTRALVSSRRSLGYQHGRSNGLLRRRDEVHGQPPPG